MWKVFAGKEICSIFSCLKKIRLPLRGPAFSRATASISWLESMAMMRLWGSSFLMSGRDG